LPLIFRPLPNYLCVISTNILYIELTSYLIDQNLNSALLEVRILLILNFSCVKGDLWILHVNQGIVKQRVMLEAAGELYEVYKFLCASQLYAAVKEFIN